MFLEPGESRKVTVMVAPELLAYYHDVHHQRVIEADQSEILVGVSAADIRASLPMELKVGTLPAVT